MRTPSPARLAVALLFLAALLLPATAGAVTWTPITSGTTAEITAIEYQSPTRFWFTTSAGSIYTRQPGGTFTQTRAPSGVRLSDVQFDSAGKVGIAVGAAGTVLRSEDFGATWSPIAGIPVSRVTSSFPNCTVSDPLGDVNHVRFAGDGQVWIFAQGSQLAVSSPPDPANVGKAGTWIDANRNTMGTPSAADDVCRIKGDIYADGHADGFFPAPGVGYVVAGFSSVFFSATALDLSTSFAKKAGGAGNAFDGRRVLAGDPENPSRMWSVNPAPYARSTTAMTGDAFGSSEWWTIANPTKREFTANGPYDVDYAGGTVLSAGDAGMVLASTNGRDFYYVDATGSLATQDWRSVGLADGNNGAIGGTNGALAITTDNAVMPVVVTTPPATTPPGATTPPVTTTPPTTKTPTATLPSSSKPPVVGGGATIAKKQVVLKVRGTLGVPAGVSRSAACSGQKMTISIYKKTKKLKSKKVKLDSACRYKGTLKVKRKVVGSATRLKLRVSFPGNAVLRKVGTSYSVKVKAAKPR